MSSRVASQAAPQEASACVPHAISSHSAAPPPRSSKSDGKRSHAQQSGSSIVVLILLLAWSGWQINHGQHYTPRSAFGFYLGVAGSVMMLGALLGYPLRKRIRFMHRWGAIKHWFRLHMFLGLAGPILILFHATFHVRSINAGIALISMLLVVASGLIGRFIYARIHLGLYGRRATMKLLEEQLGKRSEITRSFLPMTPRIEESLKRFHQRALNHKLPFPENIMHTFTLGIFRKWYEYRCRWELWRTWQRSASPTRTVTPEKAQRLIVTYLKEIQRVAQFTLYERVFALWHVLHIPLLYVLAASGIFHVIAVYMY